MNLIAHRGYKTLNIRENTVEAFKNALNNGFLGIELDVRKTKDDVLVVCHDFFIDRVSDGKGAVKDYTYKELLNYNFGSKITVSKIPRLIDILKDFKCVKLIELKERVDLNQIIDYIDDNTYFISFDSSYMELLKKKYPNLKFGVLNYVLNSSQNYDLDIICLLDSIVTDNIVNYFLKRNIKIFIYGIGKNIKYYKNNKNIYYISNKKLS